MTEITSALASRIEKAHQAALTSAHDAIASAIECGKLLTEAKEQCKHGEWLGWVEASLSFGPRQAQKYIRLAAAYPEAEMRIQNSHLTIDGALKAMRPVVEVTMTRDLGRGF